MKTANKLCRFWATVAYVVVAAGLLGASGDE